MAPWRLPWRDFHPLVNNSFSGRAVECPLFFAVAVSFQRATLLDHIHSRGLPLKVLYRLV